MLVTLQSAACAFFEDKGLMCVLRVALPDAQSKFYTIGIPTFEQPEPLGWSAIAQLTNIATGEVIDGWSDFGDQNPVAANALSILQSTYIGQKFAATEMGSSIVLAPVNAQIDAPKLITVAQAAPLPPTRPMAILHVDVEKPEDGPAYVFLQVEGVAPENWPRFRVPDHNEQTPVDWWFVETFTGIANYRVVQGWGKDNDNKVLSDAKERLVEALKMHPFAPVREDGTVDVGLLRKNLVQARLGATPSIKPILFLGRPAHNIERTRHLLKDTYGGRLFLTAAAPGSTKGTPVHVENIAGKVGITLLDDIDLVRSLSNRFISFARSGRPPKYCNPPKELLLDIVKCPDQSWRKLQSITRIPTMREDGSILETPGYDESSQLWYAPEFVLDPVPEVPSPEDIVRAKAVIEKPIQYFPFVDDGAKAGFICCLMEPIVRPMVDGPRPMYTFDAPEHAQGTGKTWLAQVAQVVATGQKESTTSVGGREEEIEKRITGILLEQTPFIILDNLEGSVTSKAIAQLITGGHWQGRVLGKSTMVTMPMNATVCATLNRARFSRDIARRTVLIALDAKMPDPNQRDFPFEPIPEARKHRVAIIRACLILARAWILAGRPLTPAKLGTFQAWIKTVASIVDFAGWKGLDKALRGAKDRDENVEDLRELIRVWRDDAFGAAMNAATIAQLALNNGLYEKVLPPKANAISLGKRMGRLLDGIVGRTVDGYRIDRYGSTNGRDTYTLTAPN